MTFAIEVNNLVKRFAKVTAVDGVDLRIPHGICFGLLGPNGAGKTTTIEIIEGINAPCSGSVSILGEPASPKLYERLGIQFQQTALPDHLTVQETLNMFAALYQHTMPMAELIAICELQPLLTNDARRLSGGQRQRLLLALALINDPDIVFLDEPTTGLDPNARRLFWSLIERVKAKGRTIVLTTHYMEEAQSLCDEIAIMQTGKIIAQGAPFDLLKQHFDGVLVRIPLTELPAELPLDYQRHADYIEIATTDVSQVLSTLMAQKVNLAGLQVVTPTLEDLFIKLTGAGLNDD
ncbi:ABC transporter ATP-binding protein [Salinibius halmophilus]|uniref:ABC transporter ATP-binding protein n=1 Tax=Salinibius halmophilus TaxID=1853216 RepID=UPI000E663F6E|nr:ABC transporter ATP-binding protein [Salinibius halmophilus]